MATKGCDAAVGVAAAVERQRSTFPPNDAVTVVDFALSSGCDVQALPGVMEWVATACDSSGDLFLIIDWTELYERQHFPPRGKAGSG